MNRTTISIHFFGRTASLAPPKAERESDHRGSAGSRVGLRGRLGRESGYRSKSRAGAGVGCALRRRRCAARARARRIVRPSIRRRRCDTHARAAARWSLRDQSSRVARRNASRFAVLAREVLHDVLVGHDADEPFLGIENQHRMDVRVGNQVDSRSIESSSRTVTSLRVIASSTRELRSSTSSIPNGSDASELRAVR